MPRRAQIPRKVKYSPPLSRTTDRFVVKLMKDGKKGLAEKILRQALARSLPTTCSTLAIARYSSMR